MAFLLDTSVVTRIAQPHQPQYSSVMDTLVTLRLRGESLFLVPQVLVEFWVVCTRPSSVNGLGLTVAEAIDEQRRLKRLCPVLADTASIYPEWERLIATYGVMGKQAHDARVVAAMLVHRVTHILTFNTRHFRRYHDITAVEPEITGRQLND